MTEKRDEKGQVVVTRYRPELLQAAAAAATGTFIPAEATDKAARIKRRLSRLRTQSRATLTGEDRTPRYQWFLLPAVLLLWLDTVLAGRRGVAGGAAAAAETAVAASARAALRHGMRRIAGRRRWSGGVRGEGLSARSALPSLK